MTNFYPARITRQGIPLLFLLCFSFNCQTSLAIVEFSFLNNSPATTLTNQLKVYYKLSNRPCKAIPDTSRFDSAIFGYLDQQQSANCNDQVFVQTDRNNYHPGDTIFFQTYIKNRVTSAFETESISMYTLLFNSQTEQVDSARFKVENATSPGWMALPTNAKPGKYRFVAFTSAMQNFDPAEAFRLDLFVDAIHDDPLHVTIDFDKKNYQPKDTVEATVHITDLKNKPVNRQKFQWMVVTGHDSLEEDVARTSIRGESVIRYIVPDSVAGEPKLRVKIKNTAGKISIGKEINIPLKDDRIDLRFLPEGGTFVTGIEQRIGFHATNAKGETVFIEGLLKNCQGKVLDTVRSGIYGPGLFVCKPEHGMVVQLIHSVSGKTVWPLPEPASSGLCMSVAPINNRSFAVEIQSADYHEEKVYVSGVMNTTQILSKELLLNKKQRLIIKTDDLPSGIAQITLFNILMKPIAERLLYINTDKHLIINIKTDSIDYSRKSVSELTISITDGLGNPEKGIFSLAVVDSLPGHRAELFAPGIEYILNYHPYLLRNLPVKVLQTGIENLSHEQRDLMLMVYGWKKYRWDYDPGKKQKEIFNYDVLNMKILYTLKSRRADRRLNLFSMEGPSLIPLTTNKTGEISLPLDSLPKITRSVTMMPDPNSKNRVSGAMLSIPFNSPYFKSKSLFTSLPILPDTEFKLSYGSDSVLSFNERTIEIPKVTIVGRKKPVTIYADKYAEKYLYSRVRSLDGNSLSESSNFTSALYKIVIPEINGDNIYLRPKSSIFGAHVPALFVLDGSPLYNDGYSFVKDIPTSEITSITVLMSRRGFTEYGSSAVGGVIFVNTNANNPLKMKSRNEWRLQHPNDKMLLPINIYRPIIEFYNPTKEEADADPGIQNRSTIFWKPEIYFDGKEPVKIIYPNLSVLGPVLITVNGVSFDNLAGTGKARYVVQTK